MPHRRIFISTVSHEFLTCREQLASDLRFPDVDVQTQEQNVTALAAGQTILIKLDDYIAQCDAVIHLIGQQTSEDGRTASKEAVNDILRRHADLPAVIGLSEDELRLLSYTQWEAWLAYYHRKTKHAGLKLVVATPATVFVPDHPADAATTHGQKLSQAWHEKELKQRGIYSEITFTDNRDLSIAILRALRDILPAQQPPQRHAPSRILRHAPERLFGRESEMAALDAAWKAKDHVNIYTLVAWGGTGKTSLVAHWVQEHFVKNRWQDVERYFDWSFYSQGTGESRQTSSDLFINEALTFFGDADPTQGGPWDRGQRLAHLMRQHRTLLVLDGIEPLQYPPTDRSGQAGMLKDQGLESLLVCLAQEFPSGLCLVNTRETLANLKSYHHSTAPETKLDRLSKEAAIALLGHLQITGTEQEMEAAWRDAGGHALTLQLLGRFIADAFPDRDIRHYREVRFEEADLERQGRSAFKVMHAYERWLQSGDPERQRELDLLRLTGLFDRPISHGCLTALRAAPAIPGLTDALVPLTDRQWQTALTRLQSIDLISLTGPAGDTSQSCDAHPLIREYFAKHLREQHPDAFREAHSRLFDHLCETTKPFQPDTLEGLQPLYHAIVHGCLAGRQQEACDKVYSDRILRGKEVYSAKKLGTISGDLVALAAFFDPPWSNVSPNLDSSDKAWLLNVAAFYLRGLGRITEAREPMRLSLKMCMRIKDWAESAINAGNISELEVALGLLKHAVASARRAVDFANKSGDKFQRMARRSTAAHALHQSGRFDERIEANRLFELAEKLQRQRQTKYDILYSLQGFRYCDLILAPAERAAWQAVVGAGCTQPAASGHELSSTGPNRNTSGHHGRRLENQAPYLALDEAERRATQTLRWVTPQNWLLDIALDHLTLARVTLYRAVLEGTPPSVYQNLHVEDALVGIRNAGEVFYLPLALLTAALHHHFLGDPAAAHRHLNEAQQIAQRGPMPLFLADVHLHRARLFHDKAELAIARTLIVKHGYGRRTEELADAEAASAQW
jgi:hypothetical protein